MRFKLLAVIGVVVAGVLWSAPASSAATKVAAGSQHACALVKGVAYCWGRNNQGQLGLGATAPGESAYPAPVDTSGLPNGVSFTSLAAGQEHTCALTSVGTI